MKNRLDLAYYELHSQPMKKRPTKSRETIHLEALSTRRQCIVRGSLIGMERI
jgi:hypothetical protein